MNWREDNKGYGWTNLKKIEIIAMSHGFSVVGGGGGGEEKKKKNTQKKKRGGGGGGGG